jgi:hypothetical protein
VEESLRGIRSEVFLWDHEVDRSAIQLWSCFVIRTSEGGVDRGVVVGVYCEQYQKLFMRTVLGGGYSCPYLLHTNEMVSFACSHRLHSH